MGAQVRGWLEEGERVRRTLGKREPEDFMCGGRDMRGGMIRERRPGDI
jgi:hypothetical protein